MSDTPRTDAAANESIVRVYETSKQLERELVEAREEIRKIHKDLGHELRDPNGTIWDECKRLQRELAEAREQRDECERQFQAKVNELIGVMNQRDMMADALEKAEVGILHCKPLPSFDIATLPTIRAALKANQ